MTHIYTLEQAAFEAYFRTTWEKKLGMCVCIIAASIASHVDKFVPGSCSIVML